MAALVLAACGDDDDADAGPTSSAGGSAATAAELVPDLKDLGFNVAQSGKIQGSTADQDAYFAILANTSGKVNSVRTEINLHPKAEVATQQFTALADALRNPPPDLFGPNATQQDGAPVFQADQSRSYKTAKADGQGMRVFTDVYRMGRAVVIVYAIGPDGADTENVRKQVAERMNKLAPR